MSSQIWLQRETAEQEPSLTKWWWVEAILDLDPVVARLGAKEVEKVFSLGFDAGQREELGESGFSISIADR